MICPHCSTNVKRKERVGRRCGACNRVFALEPKEDPLLLHDVRLRRLAARLSDNGRLRYTATQLWYAAARKTLRAGEHQEFGLPITMAVIAAGLFVVGGVTGTGAAYFFAALAGIVAVGALLSRLDDRSHRGEIRMTLPDFRSVVLRRWRTVYGAPPRGMVDEDELWAPARASISPRVALLCPDPSVTACLYANHVPQEHGILPVSSIDRLPADLPVLVVHDATVSGCLLAAQARRAVGDRSARDLGVRPRSVMGRGKKAVRLRGPRATEDAVRELSAYGQLTDREIRWLAKGWWSPVAAVPPGRLIAVVTEAADRVLAGVDPDARRAQAVGFMTWPTEAGGDGA